MLRVDHPITLSRWRPGSLPDRAQRGEMRLHAIVGPSDIAAIARVPECSARVASTTPVLFSCSLRSAGHEGGDDVAGVTVQVVPCPVVAGGRPWIGMAGGDLDVPERHPGVEGGNEAVPQ